MAEVTNRFALCNQMAEQAKASKREAYEFKKHRWENIWTYLSEGDVYCPDGVMRPLHQIKRRAYYALQSFVYSGESAEIDSERIALNGSYARNTEFEALWNLFQVALTKDEMRKLTHSQRETVTLAHMAKVSNVNSARLISNVLSITVNAAYKRLRTALEKTYNIDIEFDIIEIKDALESTPRYCPFCAEQGKIERIPNPKNAMCWAHHDRFVRREDFGWYPRDEYERVLFESSSLYWQKVRGNIDKAA
jgi:hypothetical protein